MINSTINLRKNSSQEYFKVILHYFRVLFTLGLYNGRSMNALILFFVAFAEVQVAVLSVLNLPRQGFPGHLSNRALLCLSQLLFASEILCDLPGDSRTYSKQRMNKISPSRLPCWLKTQNARYVMLNGIYRICLWPVARKLRIPNRWKERFMTKAKSQSACNPCVIRVLRARHNYKLASLDGRVL